MFSSLTGPSLPNHLYTIAAESGSIISDPSEQSNSWGCDADDTSNVLVMDSQDTITRELPCVDFQTLADSSKLQA
jgi:hypothetical protein